ncbi:BspA family leucine-rich repeat surface protein [Scrofimicrobium sp. R131]|uniref:BspA family leucine-rich repeat surface protein n=1 Tax=Scrofimicrobium appendicitidis TaxID=3079930 RepID=A0AAU7V4S6_9ACTO
MKQTFRKTKVVAAGALCGALALAGTTSALAAGEEPPQSGPAVEVPGAPAQPIAPASIPVGGVSGVWGEVSWQIDEAGVLEIGPGHLFDQMDMSQGWRVYSDDITKVVFTGPDPTILAENSSGLFQNMYLVTEFEGLENVDASQVRTLANAFSSLLALQTLDLSSWDTSSLQDLSFTFAGSFALTSLDVSTWNTSNVTSLFATFAACEALVDLDISNWNVGQVQSMNITFLHANSLEELDLSNWNPAQNYSLSGTFSEMASLRSLNLAGWDLSNVTDLASMAANTPSLETLDLSGWDTRHIFSSSLMLQNSAVSTLILGENTVLSLFSDLRDLAADDVFTGNWVEIGSGTVDEPRESSWEGTSSDLLTRTQDVREAGTYVLQRHTTVEFDANHPDATGSVAAVTGRTGFPVLIPANEFEAADYTFNGWNLAADGTSTHFSVGESAYFGGGTTTVFAQWVPVDVDPDPEPEPSPTPDPDEKPEDKPKDSENKDLAQTGASGLWLGLAALGLLGLGAGTTVWSRRRNA